MAAIFGGTKIFEKLGQLLSRVSLRIKNFVEIALSSMVFEIQAFLCFAIFVKNSKIQNGRHFWWDQKFSKKLGHLLRRVTLRIKNFIEIALSGTVFEIQAFLCFMISAKNLENSKWLPFLVGQKIFENWVSYSEELPYGSKISSKSLYLARFSRYKHFYVLHF